LQAVGGWNSPAFFPLLLESALEWLLWASLLAVLDSSCTALAENDGYGPNARVEIVAPADGILIIAATSYPDYGYTGQGTSAGSYRLSLTRLPLAELLAKRLKIEIDDLLGDPGCVSRLGLGGKRTLGLDFRPCLQLSVSHVLPPPRSQSSIP
jgi:hypothetical protein